MKHRWKEGDTSRAICSDCRKLVSTEFQRRRVTLLLPKVVEVDNVLVAVCWECNEIVAIPHHSMHKINRARNRS